MNVDDIEDVYSAVRWLSEHGVEINDNRQKGGYNAKIKKCQVQNGKSKGHRQRTNVV